MENKKYSGIVGTMKKSRDSSKYLKEETGMDWTRSKKGSGKNSYVSTSE
jgi:hypothetical protein